MRGLTVRTCSLNHCDQRHFAKGYCNLHWQRQHRNGMVSTKYGTAKSRFEKKVKKTPGCWTWVGAIAKNGYGVFWLDRKNIYAHRFAYGSVPDGMVIDHLCRNRSCVNPSHLEAVTQRENVLRGAKCNKELIHD